MSSADPINGFFAGGSRHPSDLVTQSPSVRRGSTPATSRSRIAIGKNQKRGRAVPMGPTPERLAKGDIPNAKVGGFHRSVPPIERLRDQGKLAASVDHAENESKLTANARRENQACFLAAEKLRRHFEGCMIGVKAQDLNHLIAGGGASELTQEEGWVHHYDTFRKACRLMGWSEANPRRGAGRMVVAVVCYEETVGDAALVHIGRGRDEVVKAQGMDRLREGLYMLAVLWGMC